MATTINPVVHYRDLEAGSRFLIDAFGFEQLEAYKDDSGAVQYMELALNGVPLGLGPHTEGSMFDTGPAVVYISLDDVDPMHERAAAGGAEILMPPTDQDYGSRDFVAKDPEGNVWCFGTFQPGSYNPARHVEQILLPVQGVVIGPLADRHLSRDGLVRVEDGLQYALAGRESGHLQLKLLQPGGTDRPLHHPG